LADDSIPSEREIEPVPHPTAKNSVMWQAHAAFGGRAMAE
jgi:hypothetical protein